MSRILVVDDDLEIRLYLRHLLQKAGYSVVTAASGHKALVVQNNTTFDVAIIDLVMPDCDGVEVVKTMHASTKKIVISGLAGLLAGIQDLGVDVVLSKPLSEDAILSAVGNLLGKGNV